MRVSLSGLSGFMATLIHFSSGRGDTTPADQCTATATAERLEASHDHLNEAILSLTHTTGFLRKRVAGPSAQAPEAAP